MITPSRLPLLLMALCLVFTTSDWLYGFMSISWVAWAVACVITYVIALVERYRADLEEAEVKRADVNLANALKDLDLLLERHDAFKDSSTKALDELRARLTEKTERADELEDLVKGINKATNSVNL